MNLLLKEIRHNPLLWLLVFVPVVFAAAKLKPEAHTLLFVLSVLAIVPLAALLSHATESVAAKTGDAVGRAAQRHAGKPDRAGHRAHRPARRGVHAGEGVHRRRDRHQHAVHAGRVVSARRTQAPRAGVQPGQRPHPGGSALPGHGRAADSLGGRHGRLGGGGGVHPEAERGPGGAAHRRLRTGHAVLAQDAPRAVCQRGTRRGRRSALADGAGPGHAGRRHGAGRARERDLRRVGAEGGGDVRDDPRVRRFHRRGAGGRRGGDGRRRSPARARTGWT